MIIASMYPCPFDMQERHDHNATIIKENQIYSYEEEKLTGIKNEETVRFPERSLMMGMKELDIVPSDVDIWVFPTPLKLNIRSLYFFFSWILKAFEGDLKAFKKWIDKRVKFIPHQVSHAALGVYGSSFKETAFLCLDGGGDMGDKRNYIFGDYKNNKFNIKNYSSGRKNIGSFHGFLTDSLGYSSNENGKVSGLAGYGKVQEELAKNFSKLIRVSENGIFFYRERHNKTEINLSKIKPREYNRSKFMNSFL